MRKGLGVLLALVLALLPGMARSEAVFTREVDHIASMETAWSTSRVKTASPRAIPGSSARTSASSAPNPLRIAFPSFGFFVL